MDTLAEIPMDPTVGAVEPFRASGIRVISRKASAADSVAKAEANSLAEEILAVRDAKQAANAAGNPDPYPARRVLESDCGSIMLIYGRDRLVGISAVLNPGISIETAYKEVILPAVEKEFPGQKFQFVYNGGSRWPGSGEQARVEQAAAINLLGGGVRKPSEPYKYQKG
jgi:hypothetical protein